MPNFSWNDGRAATQALYHFDADLADASLFGRDLTSGGGIGLSTTRKKFGAKSLLTNNAARAYIAGYNYNLNNQWTVDFWLSGNGATTSNGCIWADSETLNATGIYLYNVRGGGDNLYLEYKTATNTYNVLIFTTLWGGTGFVHIAIVKESPTLIKCYGGGAYKTSLTISGTPSSSTVNYIGTLNNFTDKNGNNVNDSFVGYYDEFRISSTARWVANFTPPTSAYVY